MFGIEGWWLVFLNRKLGAWWCRSCLGIPRAQSPFIPRVGQLRQVFQTAHSGRAEQSRSVIHVVREQSFVQDHLKWSPRSSIETLVADPPPRPSALLLNQPSLMHTCDS
jgi:hypothetical protein